MTENDTDPQGQAPTDPITDPTTPADPTPPTQPETEDDFDKERALRTIRTLRESEKQAKVLAQRVAEYEKRERERSDADLSEKDRLTTQLKRTESELELERQQHRDAMNRHEVERSAARLNIVDPEAAVKLLDWGALDYDDDGRPQNVEDALKALVEGKPYLVRTDTGHRPAGNPTNPATRQQNPAARRYTTAEIADRAVWLANKDDIMRAMREDRIDS